MNLKQWQDWKKINNRELAKKLNINETLISHWRSGRRNPNPTQALLIEKITRGQVRKEELIWPDYDGGTGNENFK